ncbi:serine/threonine protein phosphatase 1 [Rhodovulum bhavnagarense]|uniref:Serine/threonine protein phosphatase 1 n=1 Tax=Rhodovulum bhavnagarense TaxID=992286 RepID=A0A4R2R8U9_9RHOB|nr:metallophosphoesterase [Rhodovulum bhavnagarense]TCP58357.1 serine/threonine protein phosphatase 1 [Rhodovulum bhavnagarense]
MIRALKKRLFSRPALRPAHTSIKTLAPETAFFAVGDVHGTLAPLKSLLAVLDDHDPNCPIVFVGDYVDRGEDSAGVLRFMCGMVERSHRDILCLRGNHEQMLLDFLVDPVTTAPVWFSAGGRHTLGSYGLTPGRMKTADDLKRLRDEFRTRLGERTERWLHELPLSWQNGNVLVSHAGADPEIDFVDQPHDALLWGTARHPDRDRADDGWIVQGHLTRETARIEGRRILLDSGAYATSILSAAYLSQGSLRFFNSSHPNRS